MFGYLLLHGGMQIIWSSVDPIFPFNSILLNTPTLHTPLNIWLIDVTSRTKVSYIPLCSGENPGETEGMWVHTLLFNW